MNDSEIKVAVADDALTGPASSSAPETDPVSAVEAPLVTTSGVAASVMVAVRELVQTILLALLLFLAIRNVVLNFRIDGISMEPNFHNGQYLIVNRFAYCPGFHLELPPLGIKWQKTWCVHSPRRGDVIVFEYPLDESRDFIKRVIALPGETIEIRGGKVYINGKLMPEPFGPNPTNRNFGPLKVPPDTVFVMGDNRNNSSDSRTWGPLPQKDIIGKAVLSYWPPRWWAIVPQYDLTDLSAAN
ncbi:MAG: signal peptidase I [Anaerolineae bacterium]